MKLIKLTQNLVTIVDDDVYEELSRHKWFAKYDPSIQGHYAYRAIRIPGPVRKTTSEPMHRRILGLRPGDGKVVDHLNRDALDNRRANLRVTTIRGNAENQRNQSSCGAGVRFRPEYKRNPFQAAATVKGKWHHIGCFATLEEAHKARRKWLEAMFTRVEVTP